MIEKLIETLTFLPGVGEKTASRLADFILKQPINKIEEFGNNIINLRKEISYCQKCFNYSKEKECQICQSDKRIQNQYCLVPTTKELQAIESTNSFKGKYHVLQGLIDPINGVSLDKIKLKEFIKRLQNILFLYKPEEVEVILALGSNIEAVATSLYIKKTLEIFNIKITEIAYGISVGSEIENADPMSIAKALENRK